MPGLFYPQCRAILQVVLDGFGAGDSDPVVVQVIPRTASVHCNSYKEADTWELTFDAKSLPFSPEIVRSMGVEIYLFDAGGIGVDPEAFATEKAMLVAGLADNASLRYSSDGREFTCDGKDYTILMLDRQWDPKKKVAVGRPLDTIVQELVDEAVGATLHGGRTLTVRYLSSKAIPVVGAAWSKTTKKGKPVKSGYNFWDVIYNTVVDHGFVVFVRGFEVIITDPQNLSLSNASKVKKMAYGRNLSSLEVERKIGKERTPQIKVVSYDARTRTSISAVFPESKDKVKSGIGTEKDDVQVMVVDGVHDAGFLKDIAESRYNSLARSEGRIKFTTRDLKDLEDADLLTLRAGDAVAIGFDPFNDEEMRVLRTEQRFALLMNLGYSSQVASLVAQEYDKLDQFKKAFYVRDVNFAWDAQQGVTIDCEAMNFIAAGRDDASAASLVRQAKMVFNEIADKVADLLGVG